MSLEEASMAEEKKQEETIEEQSSGEETTALADLTKTVKEQKQEIETMRKEFEKEKKALVRQALDGGKVQSEEVNKEELQERKKVLVNKMKNADTMSNMDVWATSLELRDTNLKLTGVDDYQSANAVRSTHGEEVAKLIRDALKDAKGNATIFNGLIGDRVRDNPLYAQLANKAAANKR